MELFNPLKSWIEPMEKKMNLMSLLFLITCVVGFDHFYRGVMHHQNSLPKDKTYQEFTNEKTKRSPYEIYTMKTNYNHKLAKLK